MGKPIAVTDSDFETQVINSPKPVLVDFWATWCGPCKMIAPVLEQLAGENEERLTIAKVDVDSNPGTAARFGVRSILNGERRGPHRREELRADLEPARGAAQTAHQIFGGVETGHVESDGQAIARVGEGLHRPRD